MGFFDVPIVLGLLFLIAVGFVVARWRRRRPDEWREGDAAKGAAPLARERGEKSPERP